jgi:DNA end-binding protein Ku
MPPLRTGASLSFGLVSIPVELQPAIKKPLAARQAWLADPVPLFTARSVTLWLSASLVRGYEFAKDQYVHFTEADLESLETEFSNNIDLKEFVPLSKIAC